MFIKSHDSFAFLAFGSTRYSAAKPQRLLLIGRAQARKRFPRRSRAETREAGTLPFRTISYGNRPSVQPPARRPG
ncbi:hypothetical protein CO653_13385 [Rhizobium anhuiense]|nr:hypothetical protein CO653_13385 [Rhizobium anhuiense]